MGVAPAAFAGAHLIHYLGLATFLSLVQYVFFLISKLD